MRLIDKYIQELQRRLPAKKRENIGNEVRSTIEELLPEEYNEQDVKRVLNKLGNPAIVASKYSGRPMHIIGPRYYDLYQTLLKTIIPMSFVIALISIISDYGFSFNVTGEIFSADFMVVFIADGIISMLFVAMQVFCWFTIIVAMLERIRPSNRLESVPTSFVEWTSEDLKSTQLIKLKKRIANSHIYWRVIWTSVWVMVYFNADRLLGIYDLQAGEITFVMPVLNQDVLSTWWMLIVLIISAEVALCIMKLLDRQWTKKVAFFQSAYEILSAAILIFIITRPNFFREDFLAEMAGLFNTTPYIFVNNFLFWFIVFTIVASLLGIFEARKKARLPLR